MTDFVAAVVGSRKRVSDSDRRLVFEIVGWLQQTYPSLRLTSGGCPTGADFFMEEAAVHFNIPTKIWYPKCSRCGERRVSHQCGVKKKTRGEFAAENYARNGEVAEDCTEMFALTDPDHPERGGTANAISNTVKRNKRVHMYDKLWNVTTKDPIPKLFIK